MNKMIFVITLIFACSGLSAQTVNGNPFSPALPEAGNWFEKNDPGTGFIFEIQNGILSAAYFGFAGDGDNAWSIFNGALQPGEPGSDIDWFIETDMFQFANGECIFTCITGDPVDSSNLESTIVASIRLEFVTSGLARFSVDGAEFVEIEPLIFGVAATAVFPETEGFQLPDVSGKWFLRIRVVAVNDSTIVTESVDQGQVVEFGQQQMQIDATTGAQRFSFPISRAQSDVDTVLLNPGASVAGGPSGQVPLEVIGELVCTSADNCAVNFCNDFSAGFCQASDAVAVSQFQVETITDRRISSPLSQPVVDENSGTAFVSVIEAFRLDYD